VWLLRTATVIPDNERWLHTEQAAAELREALAWAKTHAPEDADVDVILKRLRDGSD
jgi:hypothetical protein